MGKFHPHFIRGRSQNVCDQSVRATELKRFYGGYLHAGTIVGLRQLRGQFNSVRSALCRDLRNDVLPLFFRQLRDSRLDIVPKNGWPKTACSPKCREVDLIIETGNQLPDLRSELVPSGRNHEPHRAIHIAPLMPTRREIDDLVLDQVPNPRVRTIDHFRREHRINSDRF